MFCTVSTLWLTPDSVPYSTLYRSPDHLGAFRIQLLYHTVQLHQFTKQLDCPGACYKIYDHPVLSGEGVHLEQQSLVQSFCNFVHGILSCIGAGAPNSGLNKPFRSVLQNI
jgi:hypothetical protein